MDSLNLQRCLDELLDLGKKNRLLYFSETGGIIKTISSLSASDCLSSLLNNKRFLIFDLDRYQHALNLTNEELNSSNKRMEFYFKAKDKYLTGIHKNDELLLLPKRAGLYSTLKRIAATAGESLEERGINILFLTFGSLTWNDIDEKEDITSPLLLVPVYLEKKQGSKDYEIIINESEEVQVNTTLAYKLKQTYSITLPSFDPDNDDYTLYMRKVKESIASFTDWKLRDDSYIGLFAFSKIDMYHDLKSHEKEALDNPVVKKLFGYSAGEYDFKDRNDEKPVLHNVIDADASQNRAVLASKQGESFVLEGPPGTGKSQTITNIIADALYDGKRVLFVSEKKAALDVVLHKLQQVHLDDFCLPLHGNKANKKDVVNEIGRVLRMNYSLMTEEGEKKLSDLSMENYKLNQYKEISGTYSSALSMTYYQVLMKASTYQDTQSPLFRFEEIDKKDNAYLSRAKGNLLALQSITSVHGRDVTDYAFYGLLPDKCSYEEKIDLQILVRDLLQKKEELNSKAVTLIPFMHLRNSMKGMKETLSDINILKEMKFYNSSFFLKENHENLSSSFADVEKKIEERCKKINSVLEVAKPEALEIDAVSLLDLFDSSYQTGARIFKPSYWKKKKKLKAYALNKKGFNYQKALSLIETLAQCQRARENVYHSLEHLNSLLSVETRVNEEHLSLAKESFGKAKEVKGTYYFDHPMSLSDYQKFKADTESIALKQSDFDGVDKLQSFFEKSKLSFEDMTIIEMEDKAKKMNDSFDLFDMNVQLMKIINTAKEEGYSSFVYSYLTSELPLENIIPAFEKCFYVQMAQYILSKEPCLSSFVRPNNDSLVKDYIRDDRLSFEISQTLIKEKCSHQIPKIFSGQNNIVSAFLLETTKKRNIPSVRALMNKYGSLIQKIKPCFMMSPLTVSSFLGDNMDFDLIVFDEASQVFPWDAIGAIYRGKQVIIVGDNKQMPPTSFFMAGASDDENDNVSDNDIASFESILDFAGSFPHYRLLWHYRSKNEDLISFSNNHFYHSSLITFPSALMKKEGFGVDFYYVDHAIYNRKYRYNEEEAKKIVDLIEQDRMLYPDQSLGVVCMNISQQERIQSLLEERCALNPDLNDSLSMETKEPLFIKNLETVQGDERDRIILSIGYGKDDEGKLYHNFGPLNRLGGERRLNVAITRAKYNVQVVSSIHSYDIKEDRISSVGPKLLKDYLDYAERGEPLPVKEEVLTNNKSSLLVDIVASFLEKYGYQVKKNLGCSGYPIDLAVVNPDHENEYILAIEFDGYNYHAVSSTRDRERLRKQILKAQGWHYYRIWCTDFFLNRRSEELRLLKTLRKIESGNAIENEDNQETFCFERKEEKVPENIESYFRMFVPFKSVVALEQVPPSDAYQINKILDSKIEKIIAYEQPICKTRLLRFLAALTGRKAVTATITDAFKDVMSKSWHYRIRQWSDYNSTYYWMDDCNDFSLRIGNQRSVEEIPGVEIKNGLLKLVELQTLLSVDDLYHSFCYLIGYRKVSHDMSVRLDTYLTELIDEGKISVDSEKNVCVKK